MPLLLMNSADFDSLNIRTGAWKKINGHKKPGLSGTGRVKRVKPSRRD